LFGAGTSAKGWHFAVDKMPTATPNFFKSKVKFYRGLWSLNGSELYKKKPSIDSPAVCGPASSIVYLVSLWAFD